MRALLLALTAAGLLAWHLSSPGYGRPCVTDSECFIQCERELGRPCTDQDVFGDECPPSDCEAE